MRGASQLTPAVPAPGVCNHSPGRSFLVVGQFTLDGVTPRARRKEGQALSGALQGRPDLVRDLRRARAKRQGHQTAADAELKRIATLAAQSLEAGANIAEVAELVGVSRPTLYRLLRER